MRSLPTSLPTRNFCAGLLVAAQLGVMLTTAATAADNDPPVDFARDVRPILSQACFHCHGPDPDTREADLRLDTWQGLTADLGGSPAVHPGRPAESRLVQRVLSDDPDERMPPAGSNKSLTPEQRRVLQRWVAQGADWQPHWSFVPPQRPALPVAENDPWSATEVDRFIFDRLQQAGLSPSGEAPPHGLLRRLFLDLIGLPPTPEQSEHWLSRIWPQRSDLESVGQSVVPSTAMPAMDEAAYQELISYLLGSPHFGERWGRRWLDLARYADTNGYEKDRERSMWPYRDWVIDAFNQDMPFDQFTIEQIAGDMLPQASVSQRIATGFHRNTMLNEEGGIDPLEFRYHALTDRVATTGTTWLGLTLGCCQCHTHKFDPVTHTEYFQVMALLNNADEPTLELPELFEPGDFDQTWQRNRQAAKKMLQALPRQWPAAVGQRSKTAPLETDSATSDVERQPTIEAAFDRWLELERANTAEWTHLRPVRATSNLPILTIEADETIFASGDTAKRDVYEVRFAPHAAPITALRLEALPDERLPARGPGSTYYEGTLGDFYLVELTATRDHQGVAEPIPFTSASETYAKNRFGKNPVAAQLTLDGDLQTGWSVDGRQGERHVAVYLLKEPLPAEEGLAIKMVFGRHFASSLGRFRFSATSASHPTQARTASSQVEQLLRLDPKQLTEEQRQVLFEEFLLSTPELADAASEIRNLLKRPEVPSTLVFAERPAAHPRPTFRHHRGEYLQPAEAVEPAVPAFLPPLPSGSAPDRLVFAQWLVSADNPLTARVIVNRYWAALFGTGLVATLDDFGLQGQTPSHPELLDWLAVQFMQEYDWSVKQLLRQLVSSRTYRQSSRVNALAATVDPGNRLLSYAPRFRLEAEILRDSLLVASGRLTSSVGGPPVKPPQAKGITEVTFGSPKWEASQGADRFRRSVYTFIKRTAPFAMAATFDAPSGEACIAQRSRSNSPLQALTLLNDEMVVELARAAGLRTMTGCDEQASDRSAQLGHLFRSVLVRPPTPEELRQLEEFWSLQVGRFEQQPDLAQQLASEATARPAQAAAWIATARALFALDETQTRE